MKQKDALQGLDFGHQSLHLGVAYGAGHAHVAAWTPESLCSQRGAHRGLRAWPSERG